MVEFEELGAPLSEEALSRAQQRMGRTIPDEYRSFLLEHNAARPDPSTFRIEVEDPETGENDFEFGAVSFFLGIDVDERFSVEHFLELVGERLPPNIIPIARESSGNLICMAGDGADAGTVYLWEHEEEDPDDPGANLYALADTLDDFLADLIED